jgi:hypothetical protein
MKSSILSIEEGEADSFQRMDLDELIGGDVDGSFRLKYWHMATTSKKQRHRTQPIATRLRRRLTPEQRHNARHNNT